jgi:hypothetical protein
VNASAAAIGSANPRHHTKTFEVIEKSFYLLRVHRRKISIRLRRAQMRKHVRDVMPPQQFRELTNPRRITKANKLIRLLVPDKPIIRAQPTMSQPNPIPPAIIAPITNIQPRTPKQISKAHQKQNADPKRGCSPRRTFYLLPNSHLPFARS